MSGAIAEIGDPDVHGRGDVRVSEGCYDSIILRSRRHRCGLSFCQRGRNM
jgi:hypothetical protein